MITLLQIEFQPLFMLVDVINSRSSTTDLTMFWIVLYFSILVNLGFIKPLLTSLYESDEDDPLWKQILWIIAEVIISVVVFGVMLGVGWVVFGYLTMNYSQVQINNIDHIITTEPIPAEYFSSQTIS